MCHMNIHLTKIEKIAGKSHLILYCLRKEPTFWSAFTQNLILVLILGMHNTILLIRCLLIWNECDGCLISYLWMHRLPRAASRPLCPEMSKGIKRPCLFRSLLAQRARAAIAEILGGNRLHFQVDWILNRCFWNMVPSIFQSL